MSIGESRLVVKASERRFVNEDRGGGTTLWNFDTRRAYKHHYIEEALKEVAFHNRVCQVGNDSFALARRPAFRPPIFGNCSPQWLHGDVEIAEIALLGPRLQLGTNPLLFLQGLEENVTHDEDAVSDFIRTLECFRKEVRSVNLRWRHSVFLEGQYDKIVGAVRCQ